MISIHCALGEEARVDYLFQDKKNKFISKNSPIVIETWEVVTTKKYGRSVTVPKDEYDGGIPKIYLYGQVYTAFTPPNCPIENRDDNKFFPIGSATVGQTLTVVGETPTVSPNCTNGKFQIVSPIHADRVSLWVGDSAQIAIGDFVIGHIKITDSKNQVFEDSGKGKVRFQVACGDGCPPGHIKCLTDKYPGYCCVPCKPTANKINNLVNRIKTNNV